MANAESMVAFLREKFEKKECPTYVVKEIDEKVLNIARANSMLKDFKTVAASSKFQVILFTPNSCTIKAANRLCISELCKIEYGTCSLFRSIELEVHCLKETTLRSTIAEEDIVGENVSHEFLLPGSMCAIAAENLLIWFGSS